MGRKSASGGGQRPKEPLGAVAGPTGGPEAVAANPAPPPHGHGHRIEFKFFEELKQRNVVRVALLYMVVCWLILDPVHVVFHMLEVPVWAYRVVLILMAIGFPAVLLFAWAFEVTPDGLKPTVEVDPKKSIRSVTGRRLDRAIIVVLVLALGYFIADKFWLAKHDLAAGQGVGPIQQAATPVSGTSTPSPATTPPMSVAIIGFTAATKDGAAVRLAETLPRELATVLVAAYHQLKVIGGGDTHRDAASSTGPPHIAARYWAEGDVRSDKDSKSVNIRLIDTTTGSQVWSTRFDLQDLDGSFEASRRLRKLASLLDDAIQSAETRRVLALPLEKLDATELTLRGSHVLDDSASLEAVLEAQKLFAAALRLDPNLVFALTSLCRSWDWLNDVDPNIDRARMSQQMDELSLRAINLDPTDPYAWSWRSGALSYAGRWSAALEANAKMIRLDPFAQRGYTDRAWTMSMTGRAAEALPIVDHAISLDPDNPGHPLRMACEAQMLLGRNDDAVTTCEKAAGTEPSWFVTSFLVAVYANRGDADKAAAARNQMLRTVPGYTIAQLRAKHYSDVPQYVRMAEATWYAGLRKAGIPEK